MLVKTMVLQHPYSQLSPKHFQQIHQQSNSETIAKKSESPKVKDKSRPKAQKSQSSTPRTAQTRSASTPIRSANSQSKVSQMASHMTSHTPVSNGRISHSYPKTNQQMALIGYPIYPQSPSDMMSQTPTRFAGSRFADAPNPSLLPKPPKHWMSDNDIDRR